MNKISLPVATVAFAVLASLAGPVFAQVSRTPWQMHEGQSVIKLATELPSNGALPENDYIAFRQAAIPAEGAGWVAAPDPELIGFGSQSASMIATAGGACRRALDYTYFQTFVDVPAGTRVDEFKITFKGMDDASRITIFNSAHPNGTVVEGSYVTRATANVEAGTTDLKSLVTSGRNRIVITQVDWCPPGNQLQSAQVRLNGSKVAAEVPTRLGPFVPLAHGDVHIRSTDGLVYDFQAAGDYLYIQSADGEVAIQARQEMWDQNPEVSVVRAGAMRVMSDTIELYMLPRRALYVNGELSPMPSPRITLPGGGTIELLRSGSTETLMVYWPNESYVARFVAYGNDTMDLQGKVVLSSPRTFEGLVGNMDGKPDNDLQIRGGEYVAPVLSNDNIARVGESWRVRANESLFTRPHPAPTGAVARNQPAMADLDASARQQAGQICQSAGVTDKTALRHCIYDVAATGDKTFVESATQFQQAVAALPAAARAHEVVEPIEVQMPAAAPAGRSRGLFLPGERLSRGVRYGMADHYLTFQDDGNLCLYASAGDRWVWCINNDPSVRYQEAAAVEMTPDGRLRVTDAGGGVIWQAPTGATQAGAGVYLNAGGAVEVRAPSGSVLWSSR